MPTQSQGSNRARCQQDRGTYERIRETLGTSHSWRSNRAKQSGRKQHGRSQHRITNLSSRSADIKEHRQHITIGRGGGLIVKVAVLHRHRLEYAPKSHEGSCHLRKYFFNQRARNGAQMMSNNQSTLIYRAIMPTDGQHPKIGTIFSHGTLGGVERPLQTRNANNRETKRGQSLLLRLGRSIRQMEPAAGGGL